MSRIEPYNYDTSWAVYSDDRLIGYIHYYGEDSACAYDGPGFEALLRRGDSLENPCRRDGLWPSFEQAEKAVREAESE